MSETLETFLFRVTAPVNGQFLRPWMTRWPRPESARVFTVGCNPKNPYPTDKVSHQEHVEALLNRDSRACGDLYERLTSEPSRTRKGIDAFVDTLGVYGIHDVVQTNAVCYATQDSECLKHPEHAEGLLAGRATFQEVLRYVRPRVVIIFGSNSVSHLRAGTTGPLKRVESCRIKAPHDPCERSFVLDSWTPTVISIRSLSPPGYNQWQKWSAAHLASVAERVRSLLQAVA